MTSRLNKSIFIILTCATLLAALMGCVAKPKGPWIAGSWRGNYNGDNVLMHFGEAGEFSMIIRGGLTQGTYTIDTSLTPNHLDLQMGTADLVTTIVRLEADGTLTMENNLPSVERPTFFSDFFSLTREVPGAPINTSRPVLNGTTIP